MDKDILLEKWLNDTLTDAELERFKAREDYALNVSIVDNAKEFKASDISTVEDFQKFKAHYAAKKTAPNKRNLVFPILKIAAVLIVALGVYWFFLSSPIIKVETLASEKTKIELPDHSEVILNALSEIEYNEKNWDSKREVHLKGEAYFKVSKGRTFDVITSEGKVSVVGTRFNVKQRDHYFAVKCFEGRVKVTSGSIKKMLEKGEVIDSSNYLTKRAEWKSALENYMLLWRKFITGVAGGEKEMQRIEQSIINCFATSNKAKTCYLSTINIIYNEKQGLIKRVQIKLKWQINEARKINSSHIEKREHEKELRNKHPALQDAWEKYQSILRMVENAG